MFKLFKKKSKIAEDPVLMSTKDILQGIKVVKKRDIKNKRYVCFINIRISKRTSKDLLNQGYRVTTIEYNGYSGYKISW